MEEKNKSEFLLLEAKYMTVLFDEWMFDEMLSEPTKTKCKECGSVSYLHFRGKHQKACSYNKRFLEIRNGDPMSFKCINYMIQEGKSAYCMKKAHHLFKSKKCDSAKNCIDFFISELSERED